MSCFCVIVHQIVLPKCDLVLSCLDDTAVCDDGSRSEQESHDDPRY